MNAKSTKINLNKKEKTLLVFPNESLLLLIKKGEIKSRYFNPANTFSRVVLVHNSQRDLQESEKKLIQKTIGEAKLEIHSLPVSSPISLILKIPSLKEKAENIARAVKPDCVRAYGCHVSGYLALCAAKAVNVPFVLSLHTNYNDMRTIYWRSKNVPSFIFWQFWRPFEKAILRGADKIIASYGYAKRYALEAGVQPNKITLIYNKIDETIYRPPKKRSFYQPLQVICVMRQSWEKNQETLIYAMKGLEGIAQLTLIGDGPDFEKNFELTKKLKLSNVIFIKKVPNRELPKYYQKADILASAIRSGGVGIPVLESIACGLPIVHGKYFDEPVPDILPRVAIIVENTPEGFSNAIRSLASDKKKLRAMSKYNTEYFKGLRGSLLEQKEKTLYLNTLRKT